MSIDVAEWLKGLGLERYEPAFRENEIDWEALPKLAAEDLKDLGVGRPRKTGHVKELARQHTAEAIQSKLLWRSLGPIKPTRVHDLAAILTVLKAHRPNAEGLVSRDIKRPASRVRGIDCLPLPN